MKNSMQKISKNLLAFYQNAEKLKSTLRHSHTTNPSRMESSAEHSWMMGLMAITLFENMKERCDQLKVIKMLPIHDLAEAVIGDIPAFEVSKRQQTKKRDEENALQTMIRPLSKTSQQEIVSLWKEFEERKTTEAKIAQAIDKMEVVIQHNTVDISLWDQGDFDIHPFYRYDFCEFNTFLQQFRAHIEEVSRNKIITGKQLHRIKTEHRKRYATQKKII